MEPASRAAFRAGTHAPGICRLIRDPETARRITGAAYGRPHSLITPRAYVRRPEVKVLA
jgi:hypothetical protein